jgi:hypothetical protein
MSELFPGSAGARRLFLGNKAIVRGGPAAAEYLPMAAADLLSVIRIRTKEKFLTSNLKAFELGAAAVREPGNWRRRPEA